MSCAQKVMIILLVTCTLELVDCLIVCVYSCPVRTTGVRGCKNRDLLRFLTGWRKRRLNQALSVLSLSQGFLRVLYCCLLGPFCGFHWFVFCTCSVFWLFWFVSTNASDWLQRLVSEMTYNDPALSLNVFSLIGLPVWFVMTILTVVINDWIILPCCVFVMFILTIIMLKRTYNLWALKNVIHYTKPGDCQSKGWPIFFYKTNIFDSWFESIRAASDFVVKCI